MYHTIIVTMNSNEIDINEWIVHNILLGFEHIYIYDDNSNPSIKEIIDELPKNIKECVTIYRLDSHYEINKGEYSSDEGENLLYFDENVYNKHKWNKQRYLMNYFLLKNRNISKYCFFCDIDEFIYLQDDNSIVDYLCKMSEYDIIYIPWIYYGTSYKIEKPDGLLIDHFRCCRDKYHCGKSIIKMDKVEEILCIHEINNDSKYNRYEYDKDAELFSLPVHINHYITKSYKSVLRKKKEHCLGQTNEFYRSIPDILGLGYVLNGIRNKHIMKKYVNKINSILNKVLIDTEVDYESYSNSLISVNGVILTHDYIDKHGNIELINEIINSDDVKYIII